MVDVEEEVVEEVKEEEEEDEEEDEVEVEVEVVVAVELRSDAILLETLFVIAIFLPLEFEETEDLDVGARALPDSLAGPSLFLLSSSSSSSSITQSFSSINTYIIKKKKAK